MAQRVPIEHPRKLDDYAEVAQLAPAVHDLRAEARRIAPKLEGKTVWMVNSTARGGGVAEMLPTQVSLLRDLGIRTEWVVIETDDPEFFAFTKRLHNLIHGVGDPEITPGERDAFEAVNRRNAEEIRAMVRPGDVLIVHDPQPMPLAGMLAADVELTAVWRCHIGLDEENPATRAAWEFLQPYGRAYQRSVFSAPEYVPDFLARRAALIYPAVDPLTPKNRDLSLHSVVEVLCNGALASVPGPTVHFPFGKLAQRLLPDGSFAPAAAAEDIGVLSRPIIFQVSRWDRLKGWLPLMEAFARLKRRAEADGSDDPVQRRRLDIVRLVLAGPDPESIADDPEGLEVLAELTAAYRALSPAIQDDVALVTLPMASAEENALMVNALQRCADIVAQNSLREGFGLTVTEAMWKGVPVLSNSLACGPRQQVRDGLDGRLVQDPEDAGALADAMDEMLGDPDAREGWGRSAQRRVSEEFLIFSQLRRWGRLLDELL